MIKKHYYSDIRYISFKTIDAIVTPISYIQPDTIKINGVPVNFTYSDNMIFLTNPVSGSFQLSIEKSGYIIDVRTISVNYLSGSIISLTPIGRECVIKLSWNNTDQCDFDSHLLIQDDQLNVLGEINYNQPDQLDPTDNREYSDSNTYCSLDHDDTGTYGYDYGGNETISINPICSDYTYTFIAFDYTNGNGSEDIYSTDLSTNKNTMVKVSINGQEQTIIPTANQQGVFWEVFQIQNGNLSILNNITELNNYNLSHTL